MRLIDADKLIKTIMKLEEWNVPDFVYESIRNAPTEDSVEVVRCKDCKYADETAMCGYVTWYNKEDDFCSRGERRKNG